MYSLNKIICEILGLKSGLNGLKSGLKLIDFYKILKKVSFKVF